MKNTIPLLCFWLVFQCPAAAQTPARDSLLILRVDSLKSLLDSVHFWYETRHDYSAALISELQTCRSQLPGNSPASIIALQAMGRACTIAEKRHEADAFLRQAKAKLENTGQKETFVYAQTLKWLGETVWDTTIGWFNYDSLSMPFTKTCYAEAVGVLERIGQTNQSPYFYYVEMLDNLIRICHRQSLKNERDFFAAKLFAWYEQSVLADSVPNRGDTPYLLCMVYGYCPEARKILRYSLDKMGENHPDYLLTLCFLAGTYDWEGRYEEAIEPYEKFERLRQNPPVKYAIGGSLDGTSLLGWDYWKLARYEEAEKIFTDLFRQAERPTYDWQFRGIMLANIYSETGRYKDAENLLLKVLEVRPEFAYAVNNLANVYMHQGRLREAEPLRHKAAELYARQNGGIKDGRDYARSIENLCWLYNELGDQPAALRYFREAEALYKNIQGSEHPDYGMLLRLGAQVYRAMGRASEADSLCKVSKNILAKSLGKNHPAYLKTCMEYGKNAFQDGRWASAAERFGEAAEVQAGLLRQTAKYLSERELLAFQRRLAENFDLFFSLLQKTPAGQASPLAPIAYDQVLLLKGFALEGKLAVNSHIARAEKPLQEKYAAWVGLHRRLAEQYAKPVSERLPVDEMEAGANALEKDLTKSFAVFAEAQRKTAWTEVRSALKPGEAAVEFVRYRFANPAPTDSTMYAALVLQPGTDGPVFVPLCEERQLDSLLKTSGERNSDYANGIYSVAQRGAVPLGKPRKSLYELLWQPLEKSLPSSPGQGGPANPAIYFSPSGLLHRLNLGAIPINAEETLSDRYRLVEVGSTRQLSVPSEQKNTAGDALIFGGIQYEMDSLAIASANTGFSHTDLAGRSDLGFAQADSSLRGGAYNFLVWTEKEVAALETILKNAAVETTVRKGYAATEEAFKSIGAGGKPSPRILHLATHGFFFPDPKETPFAGVGVGDAEPVFKISDHPMIRSGLIMARGNHAWQTGKPFRPDMEDGILTAYEISQMNLSNTELVVLSACETGLGDLQGNEGVYGLQRAFKIAGAKYLVMSLWQVPDKQTSLLMKSFYKKWLEEKLAIPEAFRAAQKELRESGMDPHQWAGFVLVE